MFKTVSRKKNKYYFFKILLHGTYSSPQEKIRPVLYLYFFFCCMIYLFIHQSNMHWKKPDSELKIGLASCLFLSQNQRGNVCACVLNVTNVVFVLSTLVSSFVV